MVHLALCIVALATGYTKAASIPQCCKEKTVGGVPYMLVETETDTMKYGCKSNCVFEKKGNPGSRFCFKDGDLEVVCDVEGAKETGNEGIAILITGGWTTRYTTEVYFPSANKGCIVRNYALPAAIHTHTMNTFANKTLLCGGGDITKKCLEFSPTSLSSLSTVWPKYANLTEARYEHTSWFSSAGIVLIGGTSAKAQYSAELVTEGILPFTLPLRVKDACAIADASSDSFILTGGAFTRFQVNRYDLKGLVETLPDMNRQRVWHGCGSYDLAGRMVLIVAGGGVGIDSTEKHVIGELRWSLVGPLPRATMTMAASLNINNKLYFLGGYETSAEGLADILEYDPDREVWKKVGEMQEARYRHAAAGIYADFEDLCN